MYSNSIGGSRRRASSRKSATEAGVMWLWYGPTAIRATAARLTRSCTMDAEIRIGAAGWAIPRPVAGQFPAEGSTLQRYAARFLATEINSSFYRPHRPATYERWAASTPPDFRFAAKIPKTITHDRRLVGVDELIAPFMESVAGLGEKLGPLLIQLPPSLAFSPDAAAFLDLWRSQVSGPTVIEPRHASWFDHEVDRRLIDLKIARVAADPAVVPAAALPGGWRGLTYLRLHGSPQIYASSYAPDRLPAIADLLTGDGAAWCIFDNTRSGAAAADALALLDLI